MPQRRRSSSVRLLLSGLVLLLAASASSRVWAEPPAPLPFSVSVVSKPLEMLRGNLDYPVAQVVIRGEVWLIFVPGTKAYGKVCPVYRYKGPDFDHLTRQPDGSITPAPPAPGDRRSCHLGCGMWYDRDTGQLYGLIHSEYDHDIWAAEPSWTKGSGWCRKKTCLATSKDLGLTWTYVGDVLIPALPELGQWADYSGSEFEAGPADFNFYADARGGYFYVTTWNSFVPKQGPLNGFLMYAEVARCAIADQMAPGKWFKFNHGTWTEPGLGGKSSRVGMDSYGLYGNTIYSTYLNKYLRLGIRIGVSDDRGMPRYGLRDHSIFITTCSDLAKQDWPPMAKLLDEPDNTMLGFSLADGNGVDPTVCGHTLRAYNYWLDASRTLEITLGPGTTPTLALPPYGSYSYEPHPEASDPLESRQTKIVACTNADMHYVGSDWSVEQGQHYFQGQVKRCATPGESVAFSFPGIAIYWRAVAAPDGGKADVYLDQQPPTTVDCYFGDTPAAYQFAYLRTGLDPNVLHTIKIVVRNDKNANSRGTVIRHMAFEHAAESYRASAGFSSIPGKNQWHYLVRRGDAEREMAFLGFQRHTMLNYWSDGGKCQMGGNYQVADGSNAVVRKWVAPHDGRVRIEGTVTSENAEGDGVQAEILKNAEVAWPSRSIAPGQEASHDLTLAVTKGDSLSFVVRSGKALWDPVITYTASP